MSRFDFSAASPARDQERDSARLEGVPNRSARAGCDEDRSLRKRSRPLFPGVALAAGIASLSSLLARWIGVDLLGYESSPLSAVLLAVLLGLGMGNTMGVPATFGPGLELLMKRVLRIGVALLGIRLSLWAAGLTGLVALPIVVACIAVALLVVSGLTRLLDLPRRLGSLVAVGTSICGITAIVAIAPVIGADEDETSYAVATIALFGMLALFAYPFLAHVVFDTPAHAGLFLGTAIHDTSQVAGAALAYQQQFDAPAALDTAMVTKLVRNLCMIGVIPLMGVLYRRDAGAGKGDAAPRRRGRVVPLFILGFLAMAVLRTVGDLGVTPFGVLEPDTWARVIELVQRAAEVALLLAMAAVGLRTRLRKLYRLGLRPFGVGLVAALCVGLVSVLLIRVLDALPIL